MSPITPHDPNSDERVKLTFRVLVACPTCGGEGGHYEPEQRFSRWHADPPSDVFVPCEQCRGEGEIMGMPEPVDMYDLQERCGDFDAQ